MPKGSTSSKIISLLKRVEHTKSNSIRTKMMSVITQPRVLEAILIWAGCSQSILIWAEEMVSRLFRTCMRSKRELKWLKKRTRTKVTMINHHPLLIVKTT
jgi:hypothetical protein